MNRIVWRWLGILLVLFLIVDSLGLFYAASILPLIGTVLLGWIHFLAQTLPLVRLDAASIFTFLLCFGAFYGLVHVFGGMIYTHVTTQRGEAKPWRAKWSVAIVSACVLLFAAGMSGVGLFYSTQRVAQSDEPLFHQSKRFRLALHATQLIDQAEKSNWDAARLRDDANFMVKQFDGEVRFLVIDDSKTPGKCTALVGYISAKPTQATIYFRNGDSRDVDLRVEDLEEIVHSDD